MKFTCEKNALVSAISVASRTVAQKSTIPALEGIYIRAGVKLTLSGYNLETGITISVDAEIQQTGACIMPSRLFFDIIRKLPDDTVSISVDEKFKVSIRGGISSFTITAMSSEDYPELPEVESDKGISLPQNELKAMIAGTSFAVSENQGRPIHTGVKFEVTDSSITAVAVDGFRLARRTFHPEEGTGREMNFVVPAAGLRTTRPLPWVRSTFCSRWETPRWCAGCWKENFWTGGGWCRPTAPLKWWQMWVIWHLPWSASA